MEAITGMILQAAEGDQSAMELLDAHCRRTLTKLFRRYGVDEETVEDLCQISLMKIWMRASLFDAVKCENPMSWVMSIGHRTFLDHRRREATTRRLNRASVEIEYLASSAEVSPAVEHSDLRSFVSRIVSAKLSYCDEVVSDWFDGLTNNESADRRNMSACTSRSRRAKMLEALESSKEFANAFG